jgi:hypothetical protein
MITAREDGDESEIGERGVSIVYRVVNDFSCLLMQ